MKKNTAGQVIGVEMVNATTGAAFTGTAACRITGDNGTQTLGSVNSGNATHKGNGYHAYAPSQAETNFDHIAFTFTGTGAVPVTLQVYTTFPQTGDAFSRIGANGAGLTQQPWNSAWDTEVQSEVSDALTAYDPPTKAEMDARTILAANYSTLTAAQVNAEIDQAIIDAGLDTFGDAQVTGTVQASPAPTATSFTGDGGLAANNDFYVDAFLTFRSGALKGIGGYVSAYNGTTKLLTLSDPLPVAPSGSDTFLIVGGR